VILKNLLNDTVQVSTGSAIFIGQLVNADGNSIRLERVVKLGLTNKGVGMELLTDGPFEDFMIISGQFYMFKIREDTDVFKHYKGVVSGILIPT